MFFGTHFGMDMVFWIVIGLIAVSSIFFRYRASVSRDRTIQILAEKGQPIPPELVRGGYYRRYDRSPSRGLTLMFIGAALFVFFWAMTGGMVHGMNGTPNWLPFLGIFPFAIGLAYFLGGLFDRRPPKD